MVSDSELRIADMVERYGLRVARGPAAKEHEFPVNPNVETPEVAVRVVAHCRALAGMIRAGIEAESDWPELENRNG